MSFTHGDAFLRWLEQSDVTHVCLWTCKNIEMQMAYRIRDLGRTVLFSELGWLPQKETIYLDERGCGQESSLVEFVPPPTDVSVQKPKSQDGPVGVLLQHEGDWNMQVGPWQCNADFVVQLLEQWPKETLLVKTHPLQSDVMLPGCDRIKVVRDMKLKEFFDASRVIAGMNSTAVIEALETGKPVYQFSPGIGYCSGAFYTEPKPPSLIGYDDPDEHCRRRKAASLLTELKIRRQINLKTMIDSDLRQHAVLGPILEQCQCSFATVAQNHSPSVTRYVVRHPRMMGKISSS
jgi:hypothetical protein